MLYATIHGEKSVAELVNRLYQLPAANQLSGVLGCNPKEVKTLVEKAEEALVRANPLLGHFVELPPGLVVFVPLVEGLKPTSAVQTAGPPARDTLASIDRAVTTQLARLEASVKQQVEELTTFQKAVDPKQGDPDWKKVISEFKVLSEAMPAVREETERRIKGLTRMLELQALVKKQLEKDLKSLSAPSNRTLG